MASKSSASKENHAPSKLKSVHINQEEHSNIKANLYKLSQENESIDEDAGISNIARKPLKDLQIQKSNLNEDFERFVTKKYTVTESTLGKVTTVTKKKSEKVFVRKSPLFQKKVTTSGRPLSSKVTLRETFIPPAEWDFSTLDSCALINDDFEKFKENKKKKDNTPHNTGKQNSENENSKKYKQEIVTIKVYQDEQTREAPIQHTNSKNKVSNYISFFNGMFEDKLGKVIVTTQPATPVKRNLESELQHFENLRVRNVKKSLKRPHSRELQKCSDDQCKLRKSTPCYEQCHLNDKVNEFRKYDPIKVKYDRLVCTHHMTGIVNFFLMREEEDLFEMRNLKFNITELQRSIIINWLIKLNDRYNGTPNIIQVAIKYLDKCLCLEKIPIESLQLVAATCYWISQKQQTVASTASSLARKSGGSYRPDELVASEKYLLRRLRWPVLPTTSDEYVFYLTWMCRHRNSNIILEGSNFFCLASQLSIKLSMIKPSSLAFVAVATALKFLADDYEECLARINISPIYYDYKTDQSQLIHVIEVLCKPDCPCQEPLLIYQRQEKLSIAHYIIKKIKQSF